MHAAIKDAAHAVLGWKYALLISYVGTDYCGWQKQKTLLSGLKPSIQEILIQAIYQMTQEVCSVVGSGRTDAGVHASAQVAHFTLKEKEWNPEILKRGLNGILPQSIRIHAASQVAMKFHAQRSAIKKQYSYYFQQGPCALPHLAPLSWWINRTLNQKAMSEALQALAGEHDFRVFQASGGAVKTTVRTLLETEVQKIPVSFPEMGNFGNFSSEAFFLIRIRLVGTGFLKQMVRGIAGTLLQVGEEKRPIDCLKEILISQNRASVGPTAPGRALWLEKVEYPPNLFESPLQFLEVRSSG